MPCYGASVTPHKGDLQVHLVLVLSLVDFGEGVSPADDVTPLLAALESWSAPSLHLSIFFEDEKEDEKEAEAEVLGEAGLAEDVAAEHLLLLMDGAGFIKGL